MVKSLRSAFSKRPAAAERLFSYAQILLGALIGGAAYPLFMTPNSIAPGGITGIATILNHLFRWPVGTVTLLLNLPLFLISYRAMGRIFAFRSLVATIFFTLFIDILPLQPMTTDPLLGALYGGVMLGCGLGLIMRGGATSGGSDMVAKMVNKRFQFISTGSFLFAIDFAVVVSAGFLIGTTEALWALISIFLCSKVMDAVIIGFSGLFASGVLGFGSGLFGNGNVLHGGLFGLGQLYDNGIAELNYHAPAVAAALARPWIHILLALVVFLPFLGILYGGLQLLFGFKSPSWHPGLVIFILWLMSLIATGILAFTGIISTEWMTI